jgi:Host cell surface-exposed lipoprotein
LAAAYLDYSAFSRRGLIAQLKYEGFTTAQATYGVNRVGL